MANSGNVVFDLHEDGLAYWANHTHITPYQIPELLSAWQRAKVYIRSQVVEPLLQSEWWRDFTSDYIQQGGTQWRLCGSPNIQDDENIYVYIPEYIGLVIASIIWRETWRKQFDEAHLQSTGDGLLKTDFPAFSNYFYLLQCFIPGIFTILTSSGHVALPPVVWVASNKDALLYIFGDTRFSQLEDAVQRRRVGGGPGGYVPQERRVDDLVSQIVNIGKPSYRVVFNVCNRALDHWRAYVGLERDCSSWKRARESYIPEGVLQPLLSAQWSEQDFTDSVTDVAARLEKDARELWIPNYILFPKKTWQTWNERFERAGLQPSGTPALELDNKDPVVTNFFYLFQCFVPGVFAIVSSDNKRALLPPTKWVANHRGTLTEIFGESRYSKLRDAVATRRLYVRRITFVPSSLSVPATFSPRKSQKPKGLPPSRSSTRPCTSSETSLATMMDAMSL